MKAIVAMTDSGGMGYKGKLPDWNIPGDLARFKRLTENQWVVMGSNTFFSLPASKRPLPKRRNIVITSRPDHPRFEDYRDRPNIRFTTLSDFLRDYEAVLNEVIVIGGAKLLNALYPRIYKMDITIAIGEHQCDVFFDKLSELCEWTLESYKNEEHCIRVVFTRTVYNR